MKNFYLVISIQEDGKNYAYFIRHNSSNNLLSTLKIKNIKVAEICDTKKAAANLADVWNDCYRKNGSYLFA